MAKWTGTIVAVVIVASALTAAPAHAGSTEWDERILPIARAVEKIRGLEFEGAVPVRFLPEADFDEQFAPDFSELGFREQSALRQASTALIALDLAPSDFDLERLITDLGTSGLAGIYDGRRVWVRGARLSPLTEYIVAHELVHVLQHQHFEAVLPSDTLAAEALAALREGEANWVATRYVARLPASRRQRTERRLATRFLLDPGETQSGIPDFLGLSTLAPYALGEEFATAIVAADGTDGLDRLWRSPPQDDAGILDLLRDPDAARLQYEFDQLGDAVGSPWRMGSIGLFYLLASHLGAVDALETASHWEANVTESFRVDERECIRSSFWADDDRGHRRLADRLGTWASYAGGYAEVGDDYVYIERCTDDVPAFPAPDWALRVAHRVAELRSRVVIAGLEAGMTKRAIECVSDEYLGDELALVGAFQPPEPDGTRVGPSLDDYLRERRRIARDSCDVGLGASRWNASSLASSF